MSELGASFDSVPANDNALADYLESEPAQSADPRTVMTLARLAKCGAVRLTTAQLHRLQRALESE